ncbi:hypothetical protein K1719_024548 [Acacia pycnantha]|nr:hypothetical protein K1719_024548 [Acacia pycnantha]
MKVEEGQAILQIDRDFSFDLDMSRTSFDSDREQSRTVVMTMVGVSKEPNQESSAIDLGSVSSSFLTEVIIALFSRGATKVLTELAVHHMASTLASAIDINHPLYLYSSNVQALTHPLGLDWLERLCCVESSNVMNAVSTWSLSLN